MANRLVTWSFDQKTGDAEAKALLVRLCDGAREDGSHWPSQATLSEDTEIPRRTLQRKINLLVELGLLRVEARKRPNGGQSSNKYWILAPAEYLRGEDSDDEAPRATVAQGSAPQLGAGGAPQVAHPIEPLIYPSEDLRSSDAGGEIEGQVDELATLWPTKTEIIRAKVREALVDAIYADGPFLRVRAAVIAYLGATSGKPNVWLHKFLGHGEELHRDRAYLAWLPKASAPKSPQSGAARRFADEGVRAMAVSRWGEAWTASWLDGCGWVAATRTIVPPTDLARSRIRQDLWRELKGADVKIFDPLTPADDAGQSKADAA